MYGVRHRLSEDFPQYSAVIEYLKNTDLEFARLFEQYHQTDSKIYSYEMQRRAAVDLYVEQLKRMRLRLKDQLYAILRDYVNVDAVAAERAGAPAR